MNATRRTGSSAERFKATSSSRRRDAETGQAPERGRAAKRSKPVRITVDLDPAGYRQMKRLVDCGQPDPRGPGLTTALGSPVTFQVFF